MNLKHVKEKMMQNPSFRKENQNRDIKLKIAHNIIKARLSKNKTQKQLAKLTGTKQPSIARIESGNTFPSLQLLERVAHALGANLSVPNFIFSEKNIEENIGLLHFAYSDDFIQSFHAASQTKNKQIKI